jgi:hypothetical protein
MVRLVLDTLATPGLFCREVKIGHAVVVVGGHFALAGCLGQQASATSTTTVPRKPDLRLSEVLRVRIRRMVVVTRALVLLIPFVASCTMAPSPPPTPTPTVHPTPTPRQTDSLGTVIDQVLGELLATLPEEAGGARFDFVYVVGPSLRSGHAVDDPLRAVGKERADAAAVFRYSDQLPATVGATTVKGIDGQLLLKAFAETWQAPAVLRRSTRILGGTEAWELAKRGGTLTVMYLRGDVVYLVSAPDRLTLEAILGEMPPPVR